MSNCSDFLIKKEDHTIGNLVAEHLKHHPHVLMSGYKSEYKKDTQKKKKSSQVLRRESQRR